MVVVGPGSLGAPQGTPKARRRGSWGPRAEEVGGPLGLREAQETAYASALRGLGLLQAFGLIEPAADPRDGPPPVPADAAAHVVGTQRTVLQEVYQRQQLAVLRRLCGCSAFAGVQARQEPVGGLATSSCCCCSCSNSSCTYSHRLLWLQQLLVEELMFGG